MTSDSVFSNQKQTQSYCECGKQLTNFEMLTGVGLVIATLVHVASQLTKQRCINVGATFYFGCENVLIKRLVNVEWAQKSSRGNFMTICDDLP